MRADSQCFTPGFQEKPFWWLAAPRPHLPAADVPSAVDVAIVGSGVTGLNAARELARGGRSVAVLDAGDAGSGATARNVGLIGRVLKHEFGDLLRKVGETAAVAIYREMHAAYDSVAEVVRQEAIECHYRICGRLVMAYSSRQLESLARELELKQKFLGDEFAIIPRNELHTEIESSAFVGAGYVPNSASVHPGLYHLGLLKAARDAGALVLTRTAVDSIEGGGAPDPGRFIVRTSRGALRARDVLVATNGYTGHGAPRWIRRRVLPFDAYMIATEELPAEVIERILPKDRSYIDANVNVVSLRRSPDSRRILFLSRTGPRPGKDLRHAAARLLQDARRIMPRLANARVDFAWTGRCSGTFDLYPHVGERDGIHYALGYCFAGMPMGTYLGRKIAWQILGRPEGRTLFAERSFPTVPFYRGNSWFMPYVMKGVDWLDRRSMADGYTPPGP